MLNVEKPLEVRKRVKKKNPKIQIDKYNLYTQAVQSPDNDVDFLKATYRELRGRSPETLREDFCGTFRLSTQWVKDNSQHKAFAVDYDPEPLEYGRNTYYNNLSPNLQRRLKVLEANVLTTKLPDADIAVAVNFSYFCFKRRSDLKVYFSNALASLKKNGILVLDVFGGTQCTDAIEDKHKLKNFTYYWDQKSFDPVTNEAVFHIHFKPDGHSKIKNVFTYDWRMWSIPELRDLLDEVGFKKTHVYWEGTSRSGFGNGVFTRTEQGEACLSWIAYIVGEK